MRELRHDFRAVYHVAYDDVPTDEAIDLIETLPDGSLYVAATFPERAWSEERQLATDVCDTLWWLIWATAMDHEKAAEPPRTPRPEDLVRQAAGAERRRSARERLENARREEA